MPWRTDAAQLISRETEADISEEDLEAIEPESWSHYLSIGRAVEEGDVVALLNILTGNRSHRPATVQSLLPELRARLQDQEIKEQDNPYAGARAGAQQQQQQRRPAAQTNPPTEVTDIEDLQIGQNMQVDGQDATVVRTMPSRGTVEIRMPRESQNRVVGVRETTTAGAVASAPAAVGEPMRRIPRSPTPKPRKHGTSRRRKK